MRLKREGSLIVPGFQRKEVWPHHYKQNLIAKILRRRPLPEFLLFLNPDTKKYEIINGQQRIASIFDFVNGRITAVSYPLMEPDETEISYGLMSDAERERFFTYPMFARIARTKEDMQLIRQYYDDWNRYVVALSPQELRHEKFYGTRMLNLVERLAEQDGWLQEHKIVSPKEVSRMGDIQFVSELLLGIEKGIQDRHASVDLFFAEFDDSKFPVEMMRTWATDFSTTKDLVLRILGNQLRGTYWNNRADFYSLFIAVDILSRQP